MKGKKKERNVCGRIPVKGGQQTFRRNVIHESIFGEKEVFTHTPRAVILKQHESKTCQRIFTKMSLTLF